MDDDGDDDYDNDKCLLILLLTSRMLQHLNVVAVAVSTTNQHHPHHHLNSHAYSYLRNKANDNNPSKTYNVYDKEANEEYNLYQQSPGEGIQLKIGSQQQQQYPQENTQQHRYHYQQQNEQTNQPKSPYSSLHYNTLKHLSDATHNDVDIVYHQPTNSHSHSNNNQQMESTQQEKPSLLDQLKSQAQDLSEGYATFLQDQENDESYHDDNSSRKEPQPQQVESQLANPQQLHYQKLQQQLPDSARTNLSPPAATTAIPYTTSPGIKQVNIHHQSQQRQQQPVIVSHATGNEASLALQRLTITPPAPPSAPLPHHPQHQHHHHHPGMPPKFANHPARQPAVVYGPPPPPLTLPPLGHSRHSKQVIYAPMRFVYDRQLPYSAKTFPYPPSFISLTTTERPLKEKTPPQFYHNNHKSAYQKIPDFWGNRPAKSLLDSYIPSWQVVKMLEEYRQKQGAGTQSPNLQTLALPYHHHRNFKRNVATNNQGKMKL
ncbi:transcription factor SPT20 homolog [Musca vetustissima]|uniref:transcription factor SPT20 homolog n=1 Tax=Musca vetustissima TaxID=27455 RepID=UPI002AB6C5B4|nr:transcription factor SPT20 homolog [Musca vetustissima]